MDRRIAQFRLCVEQIEKRRVPGDCAEVGVYKGDFSKYINRSFPHKSLYLFDTFDGFGNPELTKKEEESVPQELLDSFKDTSIETVLAKMRYKEKIVIRKGLFPNSLQDGDYEKQFAFVSLDTDLYAPIKSGLEFFYPRLSHGGYIFVHDYGAAETPGVTEAVDDFCDKNNASKFPLLDRCLSVAITK